MGINRYSIERKTSDELGPSIGRPPAKCASSASRSQRHKGGLSPAALMNDKHHALRFLPSSGFACYLHLIDALCLFSIRSDLFVLPLTIQMFCSLL